MADLVTEYGDDMRLITPRFFYDSVIDAPKSEAEKRAVYKEAEEMCEIRTVGDPLHVLVVPASAVWKRDGFNRVTYADRFADQYEQFKAKQDQTKAGIPIEQAPFLSIREQKELQHSGVLTVESLAALDGKPLKNIGVRGRDMKERAVEFLSKMADDEDAEIAKLRAELAQLRAKIPETQEVPPQADEISDMTDDDLREFITKRTGTAPDGRYSRATLEGAARKLLAQDEAA